MSEKKMKRLYFLLILLTLLPSMSSAWWSDDWGYKKNISIDVKKLQQDGMVIPEDAYALIRLHTGNFAFFADLADKGKDLRVLAEDEKTPLKFYVEKLDPVNEMALIWVKLPKEIVTSQNPSFWLYYGNKEAVDAQEAPESFDVSQVLSYQFEATGFQDKTANANNPSETTATIAEDGLIAGAASFKGAQIVRIPASPTIVMSPTAGWTISTWVKFDQAAANAVVLQRSGTPSSLTLALKDQKPILEVVDGAGAKNEFIGQSTVAPGTWHQLAVVATAAELKLYVDGLPAGIFPVVLGELNSEITVGADATSLRGFNGLIDQLAIFKIAKDANAIKFDVQMQGLGSALLTYGEDATPDEEGGESYIVSTLNNVTIDGWVIIGILGVMFVISVMVMVSKTIIINKVNGKNKKFEQAFAKLGQANLSALNTQRDEEEDEDEDEAALLFSLTQDGSEYSGSSIYRIYHVGVEEMNKRLSKAATTNGASLSAGALAAVKASMDAVLVRENQKLNSQMVLLTIAISGGPFLGLLGTVVGVMITFAAIAVSGEVNVNSIAPGIAAALAATVAGLTVAIPALFGYNYLGSRIKIISADMTVFVDEFVAKLAEEHTS